MGQTSRLRSQGKKLWYHVKRPVTRNTHVQYESPIFAGLKVITKVKFFKSRSNFKVNVTRSKLIVPRERCCHKEYTCAIWKPHLFWFESYGQGWSFSKVGQTSRSRSQGKKLWYHVKGVITRNTHVQYESHITSGLKVWPRLKFFLKVGQTSRSRSQGKNYGTRWKTLS